MPILFLDSFSVHLKGSVVNRIHGVQVEFIPPECTGLLQPVDVSFNSAGLSGLAITILPSSVEISFTSVVFDF
jgi:hypothetical protein